MNHRKSVKWYIPIFYHLIEVAVINSHILYKNTKDPSISLLNFKKELVRGLISPIRKQKNIKETNAKITLENNQTNVCRLALADKKKDCTLCKERKRGRIRSKYFCSRCHIHVCIILCSDDHLASFPEKKYTVHVVSERIVLTTVPAQMNGIGPVIYVYTGSHI